MYFRLLINIVGISYITFNLLLQIMRPDPVQAVWFIPFLGALFVAGVAGFILSAVDYADFLRRKPDAATKQSKQVRVVRKNDNLTIPREG